MLVEAVDYSVLIYYVIYAVQHTYCLHDHISVKCLPSKFFVLVYTTHLVAMISTIEYNILSYRIISSVC